MRTRIFPVLILLTGISSFALSDPPFQNQTVGSRHLVYAIADARSPCLGREFSFRLSEHLPLKNFSCSSAEECAWLAAKPETRRVDPCVDEIQLLLSQLLGGLVVACCQTRTPPSGPADCRSLFTLVL